jgi:aminoglycoside phosphotransferase (APT) family kinase protein
VRVDQIEAYLRARLPHAGDLRVANLARIFGGASRETWSFEASWAENGARVEHAFIARRDPPASLLSDNDLLEYDIYTALAGSGIPVPVVHWIDRRGAELERPAFIMGRLPGATDATALATSPAFANLRPLVARQKAQILARIHDVDIDRLPSLERPPSRERSALHEVEKWERTMRQDMLEPQPVLEFAFNWLKRHLPPPPPKLTLVHGDYRTGNFLYDPEAGITGILDWEMAHAGDPVEDLGWLMIKSWRWARNELVGGLCPRDDFIRMYEEASGRTVDRDALKFWEVFSNVKFAIIFITGARSVVEGKTPDLLLALTAFVNPGVEVELLELIR